KPARARWVSRYGWIGLEALAVSGALLACAKSDSSSPDNSESAETDSGVSSDDDGAAEASADGDAGGGASACSGSDLCIVPAPIDSAVVLTSVWGSSANDVYAVGSDSTIVHYDGTTWEEAARMVPDGSTSFTLQSVWLDRQGDVWIADGNRIRHGTGWNGPT